MDADLRARTCRRCRGTGEVDDRLCMACVGNGSVCPCHGSVECDEFDERLAEARRKDYR